MRLLLSAPFAERAMGVSFASVGALAFDRGEKHGLHRLRQPFEAIAEQNSPQVFVGSIRVRLYPRDAGPPPRLNEFP
jgi:hypothetical protein